MYTEFVQKESDRLRCAYTVFLVGSIRPACVHGEYRVPLVHVVYEAVVTPVEYTLRRNTHDTPVLRVPACVQRTNIDLYNEYTNGQPL